MGASEKSLAKALGSRRKEAVITTKFGVGYPDKPNYRDSSRNRVMESIEKSLKALNTDYVDVYLIHWPDRNDTLRRADARARRPRQAGQGEGRRSFELQARRNQTCMPRAASTSCSTAGICSTGGWRRRFSPIAASNKIGVMAYGSLAYGMLTGTLSEEKAFEKGDWRVEARAVHATSTCFSICSGPTIPEESARG